MIVSLFDGQVEAKEITLEEIFKINTSYVSENLQKHFYHLQSNKDNLVFQSNGEYYVAQRNPRLQVESINSIACYISQRTGYTRGEVKDIIRDEGCEELNHCTEKVFCYVYNDKFLSLKRK